MYRIPLEICLCCLVCGTLMHTCCLILNMNCGSLGLYIIYSDKEVSILFICFWYCPFPHCLISGDTSYTSCSALQTQQLSLACCAYKLYKLALVVYLLNIILQNTSKLSLFEHVSCTHLWCQQIIASSITLPPFRFE